MSKTELTKKDVIKIIDDELKNFIKNELSKELKTLIKNGIGKDEINDTVKEALNNLYKFMWVKRSTWNNEIK